MYKPISRWSDCPWGHSQKRCDDRKRDIRWLSHRFTDSINNLLPFSIQHKNIQKLHEKCKFFSIKCGSAILLINFDGFSGFVIAFIVWPAILSAFTAFMNYGWARFFTELFFGAIKLLFSLHRFCVIFFSPLQWRFPQFQMSILGASFCHLNSLPFKWHFVFSVCKCEMFYGVILTECSFIYRKIEQSIFSFLEFLSKWRHRWQAKTSSRSRGNSW